MESGKSKNCLEMVLSLPFSSLIFFFFVAVNLFHVGIPITCRIGYGQRGLSASNGIHWTRRCPLTKYCFEVVTTDINKMKKLIDYPWDPYYDQFYIQSCGGDYGTPRDYHPWRGKPPAFRAVLGNVKLNITTAKIVTGFGGTSELDLRYTCRQDFCATPESAGLALIDNRNSMLMLTISVMIASASLFSLG